MYIWCDSTQLQLRKVYSLYIDCIDECYCFGCAQLFAH